MTPAPPVISGYNPVDNHQCSLCDQVINNHLGMVKHLRAIHQLPLADALKNARVLLAD